MPRPAKKRPVVPVRRQVSATSEEETALFKRAQRGDEKARDILIQRYTVWVHNIAFKYHAYFPQIETTELIAEGNHGLLEALQRFDASRAAKFSTYAWFWIVKNIQEYISSSVALIGRPSKVMADVKRIVALVNEDLKKGKDPSIEAIARKLKIDSSTINEMLADRQNMGNPLSLDKFLDDEERDQTLADVIEDKHISAIQKMIEQIDDKASISEMLAQLSVLEQKIIRMRFGFTDTKTCGLSEIGKKLKIPPAKVKDIESMALIKLKRYLEKSDHFIHESM